METVSYPGNFLFPPKFPNKDDTMAIIGVTHCPACGAVVNASWQTCLACSSILEPLKHESTSLQAQAPLESAEPQLDAVPGSFKPGTTIQYRIPSIQSPTNHEWEWHRGTIELVDEDWQWVLIIPEIEQEPLRWVAWCYVMTERGESNGRE